MGDVFEIDAATLPAPADAEAAERGMQDFIEPVSYTDLTLPTMYSV